MVNRRFIGDKMVDPNMVSLNQLSEILRKADASIFNAVKILQVALAI
jgi:hypothetical protein